MITLITGATGDGKTALAVKMMVDEFKGRPIFSMGIKELLVEHHQVPPVSEWTEEVPVPEDPTLTEFQFRFPPNAVIFIDECQKIFRPRHAASKVPPEVQAFETHRHEGIDWVLITQDAGLLDSNVRRLVKRHLHIHPTPVGRYLLEWPKPMDPGVKADREIASKVRYSPPKEVFGLYKSAEAHTHVKYRRPLYFYVFVLAVVVALGLAFRTYQNIKGKMTPESPVIEGLKELRPAVQPASKEGAPMTVQQYAAAAQPRIAGLQHTAPKYDEVTKATDAPWPTGCVVFKAYRERPERCRCTDQQGNDYATSDSTCQQIVRHGIFKDWGQIARTGGEAAQPTRRPDEQNRTPKQVEPVQVASLEGA